MNGKAKHLRVAALIDLPRTPQSGGHNKCWERIAEAAAQSALPLDLTVYFQGDYKTETLSPKTRIRHIPPVFSTSRLKFLPYVPDHTDLAPYHPRLARELKQFDVIHTTDGFFAFARTAERVSRACRIPLVTSFHTDTPSYARIFTRQTLENLFGAKSRAGKLLIDKWQLPERKELQMIERLKRHVRSCSQVLITREEDKRFAERILMPSQVHMLRLGINREMFGPHRSDREGVERDYAIPKGQILVLFVGRLDVGKNIYTLIKALEKLLAEGAPLHLVTAGVGPAENDLKRRLKSHVTVGGYIEPHELARLYASADVLTLTSEVEIRSMVGVEAMASGCPVLVSEKSGVAQLFNHTSAMTVVTGGVPEWTAALRDMAADPARRSAMKLTAAVYGRERLADWHCVLEEDLFAVWQAAKQ